MSGNVKSSKVFYKLNFLFCLFLLTIFNDSYANQKRDIIEKLKNTESLEFKFTQKTNELYEKGQCILLFPSKLKCVYKDQSRKILIINKNSLSIEQKRYRKKYIYNISNSPFVDILDKYKLIHLIEEGEINSKNKFLEILSLNRAGRPITIMHDPKTLNLMGWKIKDNVGNDIIFLIKILTENKDYNLDLFRITP
jgi:outer membrane lipoprotein-sorting protein